MDKKEMRFEDFLNDISPAFVECVTQIHDTLIGGGCDIKLQLAKSGHVVSYSDPKTGKVAANLVTRKKGPVVRIYGDNVNNCPSLLEALPEKMVKSIEKAPACRRMLDPTKCNGKCPMGYDFVLQGVRQQKCRYNCFLFEITGETTPWIIDLLKAEIQGRTA